MSRPKKDPTDRRTEQVNLRLSPVELARLSEKADRASTNVTAFVRAAALGRPVPVRETGSLAFEDRQELRRIGVNLNQIAKRMNEYKSVSSKDVTDALDDLHNLLAKWMFDDPTNHHRHEL